MGLLSTIGAASGRAFGLTRVGAAIRDAYFNLTTLLLPGNGTNGAQNNTFTDSSSNGFSITRNGGNPGMTQGTFSPFSQTGWSNYFNGATTSGPLLYASYSTTNFDWFTSGQDFTLECWVYPVDLATFSYVDGASTVPRMTGNNDQNGTSNYWTFGPISDGKVRLHYFNGAVVQVTSTATVTANTWNHIAFTKTSSGITIFVNGTATTATAISGTPQSSATYPLTIGRGNSGSINGYVSNYRILKNVTPPYSGTYTVPTAPLTDISGTKILTAQANRFVDSSAAANVMTVTGLTVSVQPFSPFYSTAAYTPATVGGSGYFDGTGDYLSMTIDSSTIGAGDFTIELWYYPTAFQNYDTLFSTTRGANGFNIGTNASASVVWYSSSAEQINSGVLRQNAWNHIAFTRTSNTLRLYLNGSQTGATPTVSTNFSATTCWVGDLATSGTEPAQGYISGLRVVTQSLASGSTYTVPTAPPTAIANTSLLLNFTNAGITDATAKNDLETVGNAQISTTQSKFGGSSMYFDGTGDYLVAPNSQNFALGSGDFTVEAWVYVAASKLQAIMDTRAVNTNTTGIALAIDASNFPYVYVNNSTLFTSSTAISLNTWTHLAMVRSSGTITLYINGTKPSTGSAANTTNLIDTALTVGSVIDYRDATATLHFNGYIDELRITRFARYTGNFTPQTSQWQDQ